MERLMLNKKLKGTGLVEVIVVIGILSVTLVSVMLVTGRSIRQVKDDELADKATGYQIRALELAKSPAELTISGDLQVGDVSNFYLDFANQTQGQLTLSPALRSQDLTTTDCDQNSEYFVNVTKEQTTEIFCNQIQVTLKSQQVTNGSTGSNVLYYEIKSIVVYGTSKGFEKKELLAFRRV